jgi:hypothetical protein
MHQLPVGCFTAEVFERVAPRGIIGSRGLYTRSDAIDPDPSDAIDSREFRYTLSNGDVQMIAGWTRLASLSSIYQVLADVRDQEIPENQTVIIADEIADGIAVPTLLVRLIEVRSRDTSFWMYWGHRDGDTEFSLGATSLSDLEVFIQTMITTVIGQEECASGVNYEEFPG